jgi:hypothetical protein
MRHLAVGHAEVFSVVGNPLPTSLDRGGPAGDLMELNGWVCPQMLTRYGASVRAARARRTYDRIMNGEPWPWPRLDDQALSD